MTLKIALLGAEHWHVPLYAKAFADAGCEVVAMSHTETPDKAASLFPAAKRYADDATMFANEAIEFAFVFGHHDRMLARCEDLVRRRIPFSVEKPLSLDLSGLERLRLASEAANVFASVALPYRTSEIGRLFASVPGRKLHLGIRNHAGPVQRYLKNGNAWMWSMADALGGAMINLGPHFIDLAHWIAASDVESVQGSRLRFTPGCETDEFGSVTITYSSGFVAHIECGYTFPSTVEYSVEENREFYISLATTDEYLMASHDRLRRICRRGGNDDRDAMFRARTTESDLDLQTDRFFAPYTLDAVARFCAGKPPLVGLTELAEVNAVLGRWSAGAPWAGESK